ncbi:MAG: hypothetical protein ABSF60_03920 [Verrucomicrobiota bacterium]|jgi:hypothetical protein
MDFHDFLKITGGIGALALFVPMAVEVVKDGGAGQSFATWMLWAALDTILTISLFLQHGNYLLPLGFATGGITLTTLLLIKGRFAWGRMDSVILVLVLGCLLGWKLGGAKMAAVAATLGICLAGVPGLVELWRNPQRKVGNIWGWYVLANGLAFLGGTAMTMEERFAPGVFAAFSLLMFFASRKPPAARPVE